MARYELADSRDMIPRIFNNASYIYKTFVISAFNSLTRYLEKAIGMRECYAFFSF